MYTYFQLFKLNAGAQIDARDTFGNTPLHYAAEDGDGGLLSLLLNNGACVDAQVYSSIADLYKYLSIFIFYNSKHIFKADLKCIH